MTDEPGRLPGVDLAALAQLVAPLVAPQPAAAEATAARVADLVIARLEPLVVRIEAATQRERRAIGPYVPPPHHTTN